MEWVGPTWIEVNLSAIRHNLAAIRAFTKAQLCPVIKSNAYGHGLAAIGMFFQLEGIKRIAVSDLDEALMARRSGITIPILVLTPILPQQAPQAVTHDLTVTAASKDLIEILAGHGQARGRLVKIHLKINTGMNRIGIEPESALEYAELIAKYKYLQLEGVYTHFADADHDPGYTHKQLKRLLAVKSMFTDFGLTNLIWHAAGSSAFFSHPESHLDLVRIGTAIFGQTRAKLPPGTNLRNTWNLYTHIIQVRRVAKGEPIGYNQRYTARRDCFIGVIPIGYGDGLGVIPNNFDMWRHLRSALLHLARTPHIVSIDGIDFPIVGKIAMGSSCVDLTGHPHALGLYGAVAQVRARRTTINSRIPRIYTVNGKMILIHWHDQYWQPVIANNQIYAKAVSLPTAVEIIKRRNQDG
ncbi:MAG: alanine racemase [Firmicutes bacterium]|jgi:alanine racemase|nr:alanine racemase [Bacillota bacterium]NLL87551.1 alanine racemase [Bacillota bacterium]HKM17662.1 alanine racemase [Limnochordia bacterium]